MDIGQALNAPETIMFGGKSIVIRQLKLVEWSELMGWLKQQQPSPIVAAMQAVEEARMFGIPLSQTTRDELFDHALAKSRTWPPALGSRDWLKLIDQSENGSAKFVQHIIKCGGNPISIEEAQELFNNASQDEINELSRIAYYGDPIVPKVSTP